MKRGDCVDGPRPCLRFRCRYHLALEVSQFGKLKFVYSEIKPGDTRETCALDVAERGGITLEEIAQMLGVTRERVRQIEGIALRKLATLQQARELRAR